jgi:hypothetical protein
MSEEFENYRAMLDEVQQWADRQDKPIASERECVATREDLVMLEQTLRKDMDLLLTRFEELHARVWAMEERLQRLEERSGCE